MSFSTEEEYRSREDGVLLTGATGFLGMEILARYLEHTDRPVYALVRAGDQAAATRRLRRTLHCLFGSGHSVRRTGGGGARRRHQGGPRARPPGMAAG